MIQLLIVIISIAIVAAGWYLIHIVKKLLARYNAKKLLKNAEKQELYEAQVEEIKKRYLAEDKVVNLDEIEQEIKGRKFSLGNFIKGLFFAGEVIDVDGYTGGFNLQIAFSTGVLAGENAAMITK